uniref:Uncharacterized protein n=1 Tax=Panstrongylus lignarius TaxID=156445 RepID=A0A224XRY1_9HEMI
MITKNQFIWKLLLLCSKKLATKNPSWAHFLAGHFVCLAMYLFFLYNFFSPTLESILAILYNLIKKGTKLIKITLEKYFLGGANLLYK